MDLLEVKHRNTVAESRHPWELARLVVVSKLIKKHALIKKGGTVLDIGCGDVFVIASLAKQYPETDFLAVDTAFDASLIASYSNALEVDNLKLYASLDEALEGDIAKIDLVLLLDVVEHIEDDRAFLKVIANNDQIIRDTNILITVPAFQKLFCSHDVFLKHYRRYDNKQLRGLVNKVGLAEVVSGYFFFSLLPLRIVKVIKERVFKAKNENTSDLVQWNGNTFISKLLKNLLVVDYKITSSFKGIGINIYGLSNYMICKKQ
ncbi:class I SAM-dependent methyltransferase [Snuella lapsa]|uniref:Methyltransferase type 12 domain-containing protein n=1 Tax=Snuella lapsa TaxID=870481 RepID=A0ABP6XU86_9FLAO